MTSKSLAVSAVNLSQANFDYAFSKTASVNEFQTSLGQAYPILEVKWGYGYTLDYTYDKAEVDDVTFGIEVPALPVSLQPPTSTHPLIQFQILRGSEYQDNVEWTFSNQSGFPIHYYDIPAGQYNQNAGTQGTIMAGATVVITTGLWRIQAKSKLVLVGEEYQEQWDLWLIRSY